MRSLRRRLLLWLLPATFVVGAMASVGTYWGMALELSRILDGQLQYVAEHVGVDDGRLSVDRTNSYKRRLGDESADEVVVEVWQGPQLRYTSDAAVHLPAPTGTGLSDVMGAEYRWHTLVIQRGDKLIRVAQPRDERWETLALVSVHLIWPLVALIPFLAVALWLGIDYGLRPLRQIAAELSRRDAASLAPVAPEALPSEVEPLVDALNEMLGRLHEAFRARQDFIADAAHALRSPAMALSVQFEQAELAEDPQEREQAMTQVRQGVLRLRRLTQQLLTLARLEPGGPVAPPQAVALVPLCRLVIVDQIDQAERMQVDLGLAEHDDAVVEGNAGDLRILLDGLVDNAIRYAGPRARVDVALRSDPGAVVLEVRDDGPGIPPEERARVLERFYRGRQQTRPGSGLGLSIVQRIADQHGATLALDAGPDGRGLRVTVTFRNSAGAHRIDEAS